MTRSAVLVVVGAIAVAGVSPAAAQAPEAAGLAGRWAMNRTLSQFPPEVGFSVDWLAPGAGLDPTGRGGRGSGGGAAGVVIPPQSEDDAKRVRQLTAEVRAPSTRLLITDAPALVTMTDDQGRMRSFRPDGREEILQLDGIPVAVIARRDAGGRLTVVYKVQPGRELRYTYSRTATPVQLVVEVQFLEHGQGDSVRRVYEPAAPGESMLVPRPAPSSPPAGEFPAAQADPGAAGLPAAAGGAAGSFNQQPDAELKRLTSLGVVVEGLTQQAAACGVSQDPIVAAVSKRLTDAGFKVRARLGRGLVRLRPRDDQQRLEQLLRLPLRRVHLHPHHRDAVVPGQAGAGAGAAAAQGRPDRRGASGAWRRCGQGRAGLPRSVRHPASATANK